MLKQGNDESLAKCRDRRRRRIEMRQLAAMSPTGAGSAFPETPNHRENCVEVSDDVVEGKAEAEAEAIDNQTSGFSGEDTDATPNLTLSTDGLPVFGMMSVAGRCREMEDTISIVPNLCRPNISRGQPVHFFGAYDGHGGPHVAELCREKMHVLMKEELMHVASEAGISSGGREGEVQWPTDVEERECWRKAMRTCFEKMDEVALNTCTCGSAGFACGSHPMEVSLSGSTAVVAVLTSDRIVVANCGDSRAILGRSGRAVPLSTDHKPDRADEMARIEAAGGRVIFLNGARVEGILAMSRALGDKYLKPIVISEPEISFVKRDPKDECLILASDGLWDVISNELACEIACECLREGSCVVSNDLFSENGNGGNQAMYPSRSALAAALLTRLAVARKSSDNISVIVVDLKRVN